MVESVTWLLHASAELARMFAPAIHPEIKEYEICMKNGTRSELLPLIRLRGIGRVRARRLFTNGMKTPDDILARGIEEVTKILGLGVAEQIFDQLLKKKGIFPLNGEDRDSTSGLHSVVSGEYMKTHQATHEDPAATITVDDRDAFLRMIQAIAQSNSTHIVCFDAENLPVGITQQQQCSMRTAHFFQRDRYPTHLRWKHCCLLQDPVSAW